MHPYSRSKMTGNNSQILVYIICITTTYTWHTARPFWLLPALLSYKTYLYVYTANKLCGRNENSQNIRTAMTCIYTMNLKTTVDSHPYTIAGDRGKIQCDDDDDDDGDAYTSSSAYTLRYPTSISYSVVCRPLNQ